MPSNFKKVKKTSSKVLLEILHCEHRDPDQKIVANSRSEYVYYEYGSATPFLKSSIEAATEAGLLSLK